MVRPGAAGHTRHGAYLRCCRGEIPKSHEPVVSQSTVAPPSTLNMAGLLHLAARSLGLAGETIRPPTFGPSKKRVCLRFNLRPQGSRQTSKSSTWDDVEGLYSDTLPVRFKTQTCAIFSRVAGSVDSNRLLLAPRTPHLHMFGGYNAPSVYQSRAQARDA